MFAARYLSEKLAEDKDVGMRMVGEKAKRIIDLEEEAKIKVRLACISAWISRLLACS